MKRVLVLRAETVRILDDLTLVRGGLAPESDGCVTKVRSCNTGCLTVCIKVTCSPFPDP